MNHKIITIETIQNKHEEEMDIENLKRIMSEKKTRLPSMRNQDWRKDLAETEKINELSGISTNNITRLNKLIYDGGKLVCDKIGVPLKNMNRNSKPGWEIRPETWMRNLRQQAKLIRQRNNAGICWDEKKKSNITSKTNNSTQCNKREGTGEKRKTKKISIQDKTIQIRQ